MWMQQRVQLRLCFVWNATPQCPFQPSGDCWVSWALWTMEKTKAPCCAELWVHRKGGSCCRRSVGSAVTGNPGRLPQRCSELIAAVLHFPRRPGRRLTSCGLDIKEKCDTRWLGYMGAVILRGCPCFEEGNVTSPWKFFGTPTCFLWDHFNSYSFCCEWFYKCFWLSTYCINIWVPMGFVIYLMALCSRAVRWEHLVLYTTLLW